MEKICCFTGHREIYEGDRETLYSALLDAVEGLIAEGFCEFRSGGAIGFDTLAADAVLSLKQKYPQIKLYIYVPCLGQDKYYTPEQKKKYLSQINSADKILCMAEHYYRGCMQARNRALVDGADCCIAYLRKDSGGSAYTEKYAQSKNCRVIRL